jgi:hypothetical protein
MDCQQRPGRPSVSSSSELQLAHAYLKLPFYEVKARNHLRDWVLNLQSRVPARRVLQPDEISIQNMPIHLHKIELVRIFIKDEFNRASTDIIDSFCRGNCLGTKICAQFR